MSSESRSLAARTLRDLADLVSAGLADPQALEGLAAVARRHAIAITPALVGLIDRDDPDDPIRRQFVPTVAELEETPEERADPIGDEPYSPLPGLVHRYPDRVLLKPLLVCPVYCRFCFRREMVGEPDGTLDDGQIAAALAYVAERPEIREVILTGGDPLMLPPARIAALTARIAAIAHVELIRWHSRVPVADPGRVTPALVEALRPPPGAEMGAWVSLHVNHPRELSDAARGAIARMADAGLALVSQTVLLKGVNADVAVLEALFRALVRLRVRPYYLHHPDLARGTAHFRPTLEEGRAIARALRGRLTGIAQPTYVLDIPGGAGKVPMGADNWDAETRTVRDWRGKRHHYGLP
jgi:lysine 2,3-aminomutase